MRHVMLAVGLLMLLVVGAALWIDEGEVVTLRTSDAEGRDFETELWITEYGGDLYVRGTLNRPWVKRLRAQPRVELVRAGRTEVYRAQLVEDAGVAAGVGAAMVEKYGNAERLAEAIFDLQPPVAIRLDPLTGSADTNGP